MQDNRYDKKKKPYGAKGNKPFPSAHYPGGKSPRFQGREQEKNDGWEREENEEPSSQLIVGRNAVLELLKTDRTVDKIYVRKDGERTGSIQVIVALALEKKIPVVELESIKLDRMAGGVVHQGVIVSAAAKDYCTVEEILAIAHERGEKPLIVMADGIADPQNLGSLIRVCECAGVHGLILPKRHAVGLTEVVAKASAGAIAHLAIAKVTNLAQTVEMLKENGIWVFAAEAGGEAYDRCDMNCPTLIIMGSEGFGVSRLLREKSDYQISIPMYGKVNSLNVSTAAAVIIHEAARQHHAEH